MSTEFDNNPTLPYKEAPDGNSHAIMSIQQVIPDIERRYEVLSGKVRERIDLGNDTMLIVATDRISTYDSVHPTGIPGKGEILTQMSTEWLTRTGHIVPNHLISADLSDFPEEFRRPELANRTMLVRKFDMFPIEAIVRGYIAGSGFSDYQKTRDISGSSLPVGLVESQKLSRPIFTPSTKAEVGHDENITYEDMVGILSDKYPHTRASLPVARQIKAIAIELYEFAANYAYKCGIIIADTKFEFGMLPDGTIGLCDEVITPDSSRFWPVLGYKAGQPQDSFDKQYVRDYVSSIGWDRNPPAPALPDGVVTKTIEKYRQVQNMLFPKY